LSESVNAAAPASTNDGLKEVIVRGVRTWNGTLLEVRPRLSVTVMFAVPAAAMRLAGTVALSTTAGGTTTIVCRGVPLKLTTEFDSKPEPPTLIVKVADPASRKFGTKLLIRSGSRIGKPTAFEVRERESRTVIERLPAVAIKAAGTVACNCVAETKLVVSVWAPASTTDASSKADPLTVSVNAAVPASRKVGLNEVIVSPPSTGRLTTFDVRLRESRTLILTDPGAVRRLAGTVADICVALTNALVMGEPLARTTEPLSNPVPATVNARLADPAAANAGFKDVVVIAASTGRPTEFEVR